MFESKHKPEDVSLLSSFGKVLEYDNSYINIPLANHQFNYLCVDISEKQHRNLLQKENLDNYNVRNVMKVFVEGDRMVYFGIFVVIISILLFLIEMSS